MAEGVIQQTTRTPNTPSILTDTTGLAANTARLGWSIQNLGTNPLFVKLGSGASNTVFHRCLKGATGADDGTGGLIEQFGPIVFTGIISVAGTSPRYTVTEI